MKGCGSSLIIISLPVVGRYHLYNIILADAEKGVFRNNNT